MASSKREKELARQRAERQAARRAAAASRRKQRNAVIASIAAVAVVAVAAVAVGVSVRGDTTDALNPAAQSTGAPKAPAVPGTCTYTRTSAPAARPVELPPPLDVETKKVYAVTIVTNQGDIVFDMPSAEAPCAATNLRSLAHFAYFDDTPCHRLTALPKPVIKVLQCGDPTATGSGGPGYQFADENLDKFAAAKPEDTIYPRGTVAMANGGADTNGSQFFLVYADSQLGPSYTPFGTITKGLDVLDRIAAGGSDDSSDVGDGKPKIGVQIKTLRARPKAEV